METRVLGFAGPLLLLSRCPGFETGPEAEAAGLVFSAGALRRLQQQHKQAGNRVVSVTHQIAVGGTYLMHGLSAHRRAAVSGTVFYDTIPARPPVLLDQALQRGLIDAIISPDEVASWLSSALKA